MQRLLILLAVLALTGFAAWLDQLQGLNPGPEAASAESGLTAEGRAADGPAARKDFNKVVAGMIVAGPATRIIDGDTLHLQDPHHGSLRIRLFGIDAPELDQDCGAPAGRWKCGREAGRRIEAMVAGEAVVCEVKDVDRWGRAVASCQVDGIDINAEMVRQGLAVAMPRYSWRYVALAEEARRTGTGIWAGPFVMPEEYRRARH